MKFAVWFLALLGLTALFASHLGVVHPAADSLAVARPWIFACAVPVIVALLFVAKRWVVGGVVVVVVLSMVLTWMDHRGGARGPAGSVVLYQKNMLWNGGRRAELVGDILASGADIVTLQEVSGQNLAALASLAARYPYQQICAHAGTVRVAILSPHPFEISADNCGGNEGMALVQITLEDGRAVWVGAVHLRWPFPYSQSRHIPAITARLEALEGPVVVAGDFNMPAWGSSVRRIARAANAVRIGQYLTSFPQFGALVPLPIDHVMLPKGATGRLEMRPLFGSDHLGMLVHFDF